jgi:hypothetical protein
MYQRIADRLCATQDWVTATNLELLKDLRAQPHPALSGMDQAAALRVVASLPVLMVTGHFETCAAWAGKSALGSVHEPLGPFSEECGAQLFTEILLHVRNSPTLAVPFCGMAPRVATLIANSSVAERRGWVARFGPRLQLRWDGPVWNALLEEHPLAERHALSLLGAQLVHDRDAPECWSEPALTDREERDRRRTDLEQCMWRRAVPRQVIARLTHSSIGHLKHARAAYGQDTPRAPPGVLPSDAYDQLIQPPERRAAATQMAIVSQLMDGFKHNGPDQYFQSVIAVWTAYEIGLKWSRGLAPLTYPQFDLLRRSLRTGEVRVTTCDACPGATLKHASLEKRRCEWCDTRV